MVLAMYPNLQNHWYLLQFFTVTFVTLLPPTKLFGDMHQEYYTKMKPRRFTQKQNQLRFRQFLISARELIWIFNPDRSKGAGYHSRRDYISEKSSLLAKKDTREVFTTKLNVARNF